MVTPIECPTGGMSNETHQVCTGGGRSECDRARDGGRSDRRGAAPSAQASASACTPATNIEAIVDDSGSMAVTDPSTLRVKGLKLLINTLSPRTTLGAIEFGGNFFEGTRHPRPTPCSRPRPWARTPRRWPPRWKQDPGRQRRHRLQRRVRAVRHGQPRRQARIFLTDGGHDIGTYNNGHLTHKVPTYVIGFSSGVAAPEDQARLQSIASDTGGRSSR